MSLIDFDTLFDRFGVADVGAVRARDVVADGGDDLGAGSREMSNPAPTAEAVSTAPPGGDDAASASQSYVAVLFGPSSRPGGRTRARRRVLVTCRECGARVRMVAAGYVGLVRQLTLLNWRYVVRPSEAAWCFECLPGPGDADGGEVGVGIAPGVGPVAHGIRVRCARSGRHPHPLGHHLMGGEAT